MQENVPYVYLMSSSYSGSTLLNLLLTAHKDIISLGDTYYNKYTPENNFCACEKRQNECDYWTNLIEAISSFKNNPEFKWQDLEPYPFANNMFIKNPIGRFFIFNTFKYLPKKIIRILFKKYIELDQFFINQNIKQSNAKIYVDGSKYIHRLAFKNNYLNNYKIIHLVRDPRSYIHSSIKKYKQGVNYKFILKEWIFYNRFVSDLKNLIGADNYVLVKYEDLVNNPSEELIKISKLLKLDKIEHEFVKQSDVHLTGNSVRRNYNGIKDFTTTYQGSLESSIIDYVTKKTDQLPWAKSYYQKEQ